MYCLVTPQAVSLYIPFLSFLYLPFLSFLSPAEAVSFLLEDIYIFLKQRNKVYPVTAVTVDVPE